MDCKSFKETIEKAKNIIIISHVNPDGDTLGTMCALYRILKNNFNITQHLVRTTNFLATVSTLSIELRNDGTHRTLIPFSDPEMTVLYYSSFLKSGREKVKDFLQWGSQYRACDNGR